MLDILDYDLKLIHVPGNDLAGPDVLSQRPDLIPKNDRNDNQITLLPQSLFVNIIDITTAKKKSKIFRKRPSSAQCPTSTR